MTHLAALGTRNGTVGTMSSRDETYASPLNPTQVRTFNDLLAIGGERPYAPARLVEDLTAKLTDGLAGPMAAWTEPNLWLSKGQLFAALRCEGGVLADREARTDVTGALHPATAAGTVAHRAIQLTHTHPGRPVEDVVRAAVAGSRSEDRFDDFWANADISIQSDVLMSATSRVMGFLDAWPPMHPSWAPRFEEPLQARIGRVTLSGRVDLLLGRPRPDGRQTMVVVDWKSGGVKDEHADEAAFYALLATLRFGVPPYRSAIYSLASGAWTDPDVDAPTLHAIADKVIAGVDALVSTLAEVRAPELHAGAWCSWCPARETCRAALELNSAPATAAAH